MDKSSIKIDSYFLALILELFIVFTLFMLYRNDKNNVLDFIMLSITVFSVMVTYVGGTVVGLILTSLTIFAYASYVFYINLVKAVNIEAISYLWMFSIPIVTLTTGKLQGGIASVQAKNRKLKSDYEKLVTIDQDTGLGNVKLFYRELEREISKVSRHKTKCTLMMIKLPYYNEIRRMIGDEETIIIKNKVSSSILESIRVEDEMYIIDKDTLGIVMPNTNLEGAKVVKGRIKDKITHLNLTVKERKEGVTIDTKIAVVEIDETIKTPIDIKLKTEEELQYDV